ncbi:MAG: hypothetical protein QW702_08815 [Candidatus Bathyarchaeia archaeon]
MLKLTRCLKDVLGLHDDTADYIEQSPTNPLDAIITFPLFTDYRASYEVERAWLFTLLHLWVCPSCRDELALSEKEVAKMLRKLFKETSLWLKVVYDL